MVQEVFAVHGSAGLTARNRRRAGAADQAMTRAAAF
jgi:hypothetical protein